MKTLIATLLVLAAGSSMACPGEKSADASTAPMAGKESPATKSVRATTGAKSQVVAKAAQAAPITR